MCVVKLGHPHPYWLWPGVQGGGACRHACLCTETADRVTVPALTLVLGAFGSLTPYFIYMSWCQKIESWLFFLSFFSFFKFTGTKNYFFWAGFTMRVGLLPNRCVVQVSWNRACKVGHLALHMCAGRVSWRVDFRRNSTSLVSKSQRHFGKALLSHCGNSQPLPCLCWDLYWLREALPDWRQPRTRVGSRRITGCCTERCSCGFVWFLLK